MEATSDYLFECSWEVCNKVGGIYTVVMSKAALMKANYPNYFLVGPYFQNKADIEFEEVEVPAEYKTFLSPVLEELKQEGIKCHFVKWFVKGDPYCILIEPNSLVNSKNEIKTKLYDAFKVDSLYSQWEFEEPVVWAWAIGKLIEKVKARLPDKKISGQFHEWLAGSALLYLKMNKIPVGTVFTTHATMLGRTLAASDVPIYEMLDQIDAMKEAYNHGIQDKFTMEKACAEATDVFTTVSEITSLEAEKLLGRKADVLVLNGLDMNEFPTFEETSVKHIKFRDEMREFIKYFFFPNYSFDIQESLTFFIVGRYEFKNKGLDIMIKALCKLNEKMKQVNSKKTIIVFFWIPRDVHGTKIELYQNKTAYDEIKHFVEDNEDAIKMRIVDRMITSSTDGKTKSLAVQEQDLCSGVFGEEELREVRQLKKNFLRPGNPQIVTHNLPNEGNDTIIRAFYDHGLDNSADDKVKVIFYPVYLTGVDGLLNMAYYDCIMACHLGLFPSYYEPWGYTPLETGALGVPSLTTDLGGFGRYVEQHSVAATGIYVLKRFGRKEEEIVNDFSDILFRFTQLSSKQRVQEKMRAKRTAELADWKNLIKHYVEAHNLAIEKISSQ